MGKSSNHTSSKTSSRIKHMADLAEGLPKGWKVEIKTRTSGTSVGKQYKCYIAPTGSKFYSKGEVSRYLKSRPKQERGVPTQSNSQVVVVERMDTVDGLPQGWTLELKVRKNGDKLRSDPYYTDPVSGYVFRSMKDVLRYLKTGEFGNYAYKPKEGDTSNVKTSPYSTKKQKLNGSLVKRDFFVGQCSNSNATVEDEPVPKFSGEGSGKAGEVSSLASPEAESFKERKSLAVKKGFLSAQPTNDPPSENQLLEDGVEEHKYRKTRLDSEKRKKKLQPETPRRTSKRLAGINAALASKTEIPNGTLPVSALHPPVGAEMAVNSNPGVDPVKQEGNHVATVEQTSIAEVIIGDAPLKQGELQVGTENTICDQSPAMKSETETNVSEALESTLTLPFGDSWSDPCFEFAYKTLTGVIPVEDSLAVAMPSAIPTSDPSLGGAMPSAIPSSDPCLEFAYKTLIGEIPLEDYFQQQMSSTQNENNRVEVPDFSIDDFFESLAKPASPNKLQNPTGVSASGFSNNVNGDDKLDRNRRGIKP